MKVKNGRRSRVESELNVSLTVGRRRAPSTLPASAVASRRILDRFEDVENRAARDYQGESWSDKHSVDEKLRSIHSFIHPRRRPALLRLRSFVSAVVAVSLLLSL